MAEETKIKKDLPAQAGENNNSGFKPIPTGEDTKPTRSTGFRPGQRGTGARKPGFNKTSFGRPVVKDEFDSKLLDSARVTRVTGGGKRMKFRAVVVAGNEKGKIGIGVDKGKDVSQAIEKATRKAKKNLIEVVIVNGTIPYEVKAKAGPAIIMLKPQKMGRGLVAGGAVRLICDLAGIKNISSKILSGSKNKLNNARATMAALEKLRIKTKS